MNKDARKEPARVLVTGGAGYIGSHTCKALALAGYVPVAFDNLSRGNEWAVKWGPLVVGDVLDSSALDKAIAEHRPCAVMHFAAYAYVGESVEQPLMYYQNNVSGATSLLDAMNRSGLDKLVFSSSCAVYGNPLRLPLTEDHALAPVSPYGESKAVVERMLHDCDAAFGLRSIALRYFNAAGADADGDIGEQHDPEPHLVPIILQVAQGTRKTVMINGDDYDTPDGTCIRDYVHVSDLATAHVLALRALENGAATTSYNLANGNGFSVQEVIETARRVTGCAIPVEVGPRRPGDPAALTGDASRAAEQLSWQPQHSSLTDIVGTAWNWHEQQRADRRVSESS